MAEIERYDPVWPEEEMEEWSEGRFVRYSDHLADKAAELERWAEEFAKEAESLARGWRFVKQAKLDAAATLRKRAAELRGGEDG